MDDMKRPDKAVLRILPRREFIRNSMVVSGAAAAGLSLASTAAFAQVATPGVDATPVAPPLTEDELTTLRAAIDRLIPTDELGPGAVDSGVDLFFVTLLAGYGAPTLPLIQGGLAALDAAAGTDGFAATTAETQDQLLTNAEAGTLENAPAGFFGLLLEYTRQGMFGDPMYGGNKNFAGWDLIHYPGVKLVWSAEEQAVDSEVAPEHKSVAEYGGVPS